MSPHFITSEDNAWDLAISALMKIPAGRRKVQTAKGQFASQANAIWDLNSRLLAYQHDLYNRRRFSEFRPAPAETL